MGKILDLKLKKLKVKFFLEKVIQTLIWLIIKLKLDLDLDRSIYLKKIKTRILDLNLIK